MFEPVAVTYGEIRGMLSAFASILFSMAPDVGFNFNFEYLEKLETAQITLEKYAADWANSVTITPLPDWRETLDLTLEIWIFDHLMLPKTTNRYWSGVVSRLVDMMVQFVQPVTVWKVEIDPKGWYEIQWEDFALENNQAVYFLHLGFSD